MKKQLIVTLASIFISSAAITSCKKYEEGGPVKKADKIIVKEWARERAYKDGSPVEEVQENPQIGEVTENMIFNDNGNYKSENGTVALSGTWSLENKNKQLKIVISSPNDKASTYTYDIIKLTDGSDGELIFEHTLDGKLYRYECRSSK